VSGNNRCLFEVRAKARIVTLERMQNFWMFSLVLQGLKCMALVVKLSDYTCGASSESPNMWRAEL